MSVSAPFIRRPVGTSLLSLAVLLAGALAYTRLPVAPLPEVEFPTISVGASLPGASPETMASAVATPLERQFGRIAGVTQMTSSSGLGSTNIVLQFDLSRNIDAAGRDVQAAINAARGQLPANLPSNPNWRKQNPADAPILIIALTSDVMTKPQMYDVADSVLAQKLSQLEGVGNVFVGGSFLSRSEASHAVRDGYSGRIKWGADYPHMEGTFQYPGSDDFTAATAYGKLSMRFTFAGLPEAEVRAMLGETAAAVYGLDLDALANVARAIDTPTFDDVSEPLLEVPAGASPFAFRTIGAWA